MQVAQSGKVPGEKAPREKAPPKNADRGESLPKNKPAAESEDAGIGPPPHVGDIRPAPTIARVPLPAAAQAPANLPRCLYSVLAVNPEEKLQFRLGTAWAAAPRTLVTSAAVILGVEELQKSGLRAVVVPAGTTREIRIRGMRVSGAYRQAVEQVQAAQKALDTLPPANAPETFPDAPPTKESRAVARAGIQRQQARDRLTRAYRTQASVDAGILELDEPLADTLPRQTAIFQRPPRQPLLLAGLPFKIDDFSPPDLAAAAQVEQCTGADLAGTGLVNGETIFVVHFDGAPESRNWSGSPVLNHAGQVIGIYSRTATMPNADVRQPPDHAITAVTVLAGFANDLK